MRIHPAGRPFIIGTGLVTVIGTVIWPVLFFPGAILTYLCAFFFRDPERVTPIRDGLIISPADGAVMVVDEMEPPDELNLPAGPMKRIGIFLDLDDVHVNRVPVSGTVIATGTRPGGYEKAWKPEAATHNVRKSAAIRLSDETVVVLVQLTGFIARRIVSDLKVGDEVQAGSRFGLIRFGSRVDVYVPADATPTVGIGQRVVAGETVLADRQAVTLPDRYETL